MKIASNRFERLVVVLVVSLALSWVAFLAVAGVAVSRWLSGDETPDTATYWLYHYQAPDGALVVPQGTTRIELDEGRLYFFGAELPGARIAPHQAWKADLHEPAERIENSRSGAQAAGG